MADTADGPAQPSDPAQPSGPSAATLTEFLRAVNLLHLEGILQRLGYDNINDYKAFDEAAVCEMCAALSRSNISRGDINDLVSAIVGLAIEQASATFWALVEKMIVSTETATCGDSTPMHKVFETRELVACIYGYIRGCGNKSACRAVRPLGSSSELWCRHRAKCSACKSFKVHARARQHDLCGRCAGRLVCTLWARELPPPYQRKARACDLLGGVCPRGRPLRCFGARARNSSDCVISAIVNFGGEQLMHASAACRDHETIVATALTHTPLALRHASARLRDNETMVRAATRNEPRASAHASRRLRTDDDVIIWLALWRCYFDCNPQHTGDTWPLGAAPSPSAPPPPTPGDGKCEASAADDYRSVASKSDADLAAILDAFTGGDGSRRELMLAARESVRREVCRRCDKRSGESRRGKKQHAHAFHTWYGSSVDNDDDRQRYPGAAARFWSEIDFVRAACAVHPPLLCDARVGDRFRDDAACVSAALRQRADREAQREGQWAAHLEPNADSPFKHASPRLQDDRAFCMEEVLPIDPSSLRFMSARLRDDDELVLRAVRTCGRALEFASDRIRATREVAHAAVTNCGAALQHCDEILRDEAAFVTTAEGLQFASPRLRDDDELVERLKRRAGWEATLVHASERIRREFESRQRAVQVQGLRYQHGRVVGTDAIDLS